MDDIMIVFNAIFRWLHVVAGVMWIGHLWFFNFVNAQLAKTYDAESKKKVVPELMPRALYWFRWGAMWTWITGFLLFGIVYSMGGALTTPEAPVGPHLATLMIVLTWFVAFGIYDMAWKSAFGKNEMVAGAISFLVAVGIAYGFTRFVSGRAAMIAVGGLFGTIMFANVWMRIWPAQRKIIAGIKGTAPAPDASVAAIAGLRSKHNTYMSVPLLFFMVSNHFQNLPIAGLDLGYSNLAIVPVTAAIFILLGWGGTKLMYNKSAAESPKSF
jgi:uncharacterized membrane protein